MTFFSPHPLGISDAVSLSEGPSQDFTLFFGPNSDNSLTSLLFDLIDPQFCRSILNLDYVENLILVYAPSKNGDSSRWMLASDMTGRR